MSKHILLFVLVCIISLFTTVHAQNYTLDHFKDDIHKEAIHLDVAHIDCSHIQIASVIENSSISPINNKTSDIDQQHLIAMSLDDIISSDNNSDFNCSGGFCMINTHFHKKGLSSKRQLFGYFMKISS